MGGLCLAILRCGLTKLMALWTSEIWVRLSFEGLLADLYSAVKPSPRKMVDPLLVDI